MKPTEASQLLDDLRDDARQDLLAFLRLSTRRIGGLEVNQDAYFKALAELHEKRGIPSEDPAPDLEQKRSGRSS